MKSNYKYEVKLTNDAGCTFDSNEFDTIAECREFAAGRGKDYTAEIIRTADGVIVKSYRPRG